MTMPVAPVKPRTSTTPSTPQNTLETMLTLMEKDMERVEKLLALHVESSVPMIPNVTRYLVDAGGKRLRPLVTMSAARAASPNHDSSCSMPVLKLAAAVEFIHSATLLHDDVVDKSDTRRGRAAAKNIWGAPASILVGDFLFSRAFTLMTQTGSLSVLQILSEASSKIAEGEVRQLAALGQTDLAHEEYMAIADAKTAALFAAAARSAAQISSGKDRIANLLGQYGRHLGLAFQLADDALDYGGNTELTGKKIGDDFREGKITLPFLIARERSNKTERQFWDRVVKPENQKDEDLPRALKLVQHSGAAQAVLDLALEEARKACSILNQMPETPMRGHLQNLALYCAGRNR